MDRLIKVTISIIKRYVGLEKAHRDWIDALSKRDVEIPFLDMINDCLLEQTVFEPLVVHGALFKIISGELLCIALV